MRRLRALRREALRELAGGVVSHPDSDADVASSCVRR